MHLRFLGSVLGAFFPCFIFDCRLAWARFKPNAKSILLSKLKDGGFLKKFILQAFIKEVAKDEKKEEGIKDEKKEVGKGKG